MILRDIHLHTVTSPDGIDDILTMCEAGRRAGMEALCFTEHDDAAGGSFQLDVEKHKAALAGARAAFPDLRVLAGIEVGFDSDAMPVSLRHIQALRPDYILLSVHTVHGVDPYYDPDANPYDAKTFFSGRSRKEALREYLEAVLEAVATFPDYDALAHIGYAGRYAPPGEVPTPLDYDVAPDVVDDILRELIRRGAALEVNTSQMKGAGRPIPDRDILARYFALGGRAIAVGSDAHGAEGIGRGFAAVREMLLEIGFTHYCTYEGRKEVRLPL